MKLRKIKAVAALGSLTATVALLAGMQGAQAQSAPGGGSYPGSFLVPGTQTSFKVGGYVKGDFYYDFSAMQSSIGGVAPTSAPFDGNSHAPIPDKNGFNFTAGTGHNIHGRTGMDAAESRFNIETRTPTSYGELKTFIEADFTNPNGLTNSASLKVNSNSTGFRLRYAYATLGPVLIGQYNSAFRDSSTEPETLDFGGPIVAGATRQAQFRYTFDFGNGLTLATAAEEPQTSVINNQYKFGSVCTSSIGAGSTAFMFTTACALTDGPNAGGTTFGTGNGDKIPDFTAALKYAGPWGGISLRAVVRDLYWHNGVTGSTSNSSAFGWGLGLSGSFTGWWGKDNASFQINGGQGGGRYIFGAQLTNPDSGVSNLNSVDLKPIGQISGMIQYQHWWTDMLRSTVAGSYAKQYVNSTIFPTCSANAACLPTLDHAWTFHVNLIWSPVPQVDTGMEWIRMQARNQAGLDANTNRFQISTKFKF
jgi:hypothetical protein